MGRYPERNTPRKCPKSYRVCHFHKWPARLGQQHSKNICWWHEAVLCSSDNWRSPCHATRLNPVKWSHKWQLRFFEAKSKRLHLGSSNQRLKYQMETEILGDIRIEKDLGIFIDEELKFHAHIWEGSRKSITLVRLNKSHLHMSGYCHHLWAFHHYMVWPHLEYGNVIWHPIFRCNRVEIEKSQATKLLPELKHLPYDKWLRAIRLP